MAKNYYITTTLPYVNAAPHIGFALEIVQADALARYRKIEGDQVFFNFGTDEHGKKIYEKALEADKSPQEYTDLFAAKFDSLKRALNLSYNSFVRTTSPHHKKAAQEIWERCKKAGFIKKGLYKAKYCVGCELEKTESELVDGRCQLHPHLKIEIIEEENYFFKFSEFQGKLLDLYQKNPNFVLPLHRGKEIENFVKDGLTDFSISRLKEKMPWGVAVPGDPGHVMYVWFDALTNYISALGWPEKKEKFEKFWGAKGKPNAIQVAGKDNLRQQAAMWQAMLMAAGLPTSKQIFIHGFITAGGEKMSKSRGNIVDPTEYSDKYGTDALRYFLLAKIHPWEDSDWTKERFEKEYEADLANGLGNLVARVSAMAEKEGLSSKSIAKSFSKKIPQALEDYRFNEALQSIWKQIGKCDMTINKNELWKIEGADKKQLLKELISKIQQIAFDLSPFLPQTAEKIEKQFTGEIKKGEPLFPRIDQL